ncbi:hypothetical protein LY76DRAFT_103551 [Colletotrichum caudatum]|nr:hypothetical protein LY76DRAFT_103551 [Colletotrichum caudatum]
MELAIHKRSRATNPGAIASHYCTPLHPLAFRCSHTPFSPSPRLSLFSCCPPGACIPVLLILIALLLVYPPEVPAIDGPFPIPSPSHMSACEALSSFSLSAVSRSTRQAVARPGGLALPYHFPNAAPM